MVQLGCLGGKPSTDCKSLIDVSTSWQTKSFNKRNNPTNYYYNIIGDEVLFNFGPNFSINS